MDFENNALIEATLRLADYGRTNNFDLIQKEGYVFLREEIVADFPDLTLSELKNIIKAGIKGHIDQGKTAKPLNCTRIYQWVAQSVQYTASYWKFTHPELFAWIEQLDLTAEFKRTLSNYLTPGEAFQDVRKFRQLMQSVVKLRYMDLVTESQRGDVSNAAAFPEQAAIYEHIRTVEYPAYLLQYPDPKTSGQPIF